MSKEVDLVIIGGGIAGVSSAVYARRSGLDFILFESGLVGGQLLFMEQVDNYAGLKPGSKGADMAQTLVDTLAAMDIKPVNEEITGVERDGGSVRIHYKDSFLTARGVIIATGASFKTLGVKGENEFRGMGVSYCAICDGFLFRGKDAAVVGGGNSAVEEALYLSNICRKVYLIHRRDKLRAMDYLQKELSRRDNVEIIFNSEVKEITGDDVVRKILISNTLDKKEDFLDVHSVFVAIGVKPNTERFKELVSLDDAGFILTDEEMKTSCDYIWSCGDCRRRPLRQLITAASEGAIAALSAYRYLKGTYISS